MMGFLYDAVLLRKKTLITLYSGRACKVLLRDASRRSQRTIKQISMSVRQKTEPVITQLSIYNDINYSEQIELKFELLWGQ
jgi:hypothetical protein